MLIVGGGDYFQQRLRFDQRAEIVALRNILVNQPAKFLNAMFFGKAPLIFQRAKSPRSLQSIVWCSHGAATEARAASSPDIPASLRKHFGERKRS